MNKSPSKKTSTPFLTDKTRSSVNHQFTNTRPSPKRQTHIHQFVSCDLRNYITQSNGIFKEKVFRRAIREEDWSRFQGKRVLIKGCGNGLVVPIWAFMLVTAHLLPYAKNILYGDECAPITIYKNPSTLQNENRKKSPEGA
ncbi:MAG: DUF2480 family protein [bacterium]